MSTSMAQRKRELVARELTEAALQLLALKGYDNVTVDEIVAEAGVSRRTFFRYFKSKEDVVVKFLVDMGAQIRDGLAARPPRERPSVAMRHAVSVPVTACADDPAKALRVVQLILGTPALHARFLQRQVHWRDDLAAELAGRLGIDAETDLYPHLAVQTALAAFNTVLQRWSDSGGSQDPADLTDRAFAVIAPVLDRHQ